MTTITEAAQLLGEKGGRSTSEAKRKAQAENCKLGGRKRKYPQCPRYKAHRFVKSTTLGRCDSGHCWPAPMMEGQKPQYPHHKQQSCINWKPVDRCPCGYERKTL